MNILVVDKYSLYFVQKTNASLIKMAMELTWWSYGCLSCYMVIVSRAGKWVQWPLIYVRCADFTYTFYKFALYSITIDYMKGKENRLKITFTILPKTKSYNLKPKCAVLINQVSHGTNIKKDNEKFRPQFLKIFTIKRKRLSHFQSCHCHSMETLINVFHFFFPFILKSVLMPVLRRITCESLFFHSVFQRTPEFSKRKLR